MASKTILVGNLGKDPEIRTVQSGDRVANLSVATTETWKDKATGERKKATEWHRVVVWGGLVDVIERYLESGSKVYIEGQNKTRKYTGQDGVERYSTEVVVQAGRGVLEMLDSRGSNDSSVSSEFKSKPDNPANVDKPFDDEIPF